MSFIVYFDEDCLSKRLLRHLRKNGFFATTTTEQHTSGWSDEEQLVFATTNGWPIITSNIDDFELLNEHWRMDGKRHSGIIFVEQQTLTFEELAAKLVALLNSSSAEQMRNTLVYLSSCKTEQLNKGEGKQ